MNTTDDETEWGASKWLVHPREPDGAYAEGEAGFAGSYRLALDVREGTRGILSLPGRQEESLSPGHHERVM